MIADDDVAARALAVQEQRDAMVAALNVAPPTDADDTERRRELERNLRESARLSFIYG